MVSHAVQRFSGTGEIRTMPVRGVVADFAIAMEEKLLLHDDRGGWRNEEIEWLLRRAREELVELEGAIKQGRPAFDVLDEAADVGNFAMMVADVYAHDQVDHERAEAREAQQPERAGDTTIRAVADVPPFENAFGEVLSLKAGDIATVPPGVATVLFRRGKAVPVEALA